MAMSFAIDGDVATNQTHPTMRQYSSGGTSIELELLSGHLLFIDPLYLQQITGDVTQIEKSISGNKKELVINLENQFFPYGGGTLLGYKYVDKDAGTYLLELTAIKSWDPDNDNENALAVSKDITTFGLDSSSFLILDIQNLDELINRLTFDGLVEALLSGNPGKYFDEVNNAIGNKGWAYILGGGVTAGNEFDGDGYYTIPGKSI